MKKFSLGFISSIIVLSLISSTKHAQTVTKKSADVNYENGYYIFIECTPVRDFDRIGTIKKKMNWSGSGQFEDIKQDLINKSKKRYPEGEGLIFSFRDGHADMVDVIKFK